MPNRRAFLSLMLAAVASAGSVVAAPANSSPAPSRVRNGIPAEFTPQIDGPLITAAGPGGRVWAAWAYRSTGEFDLAVAFRDDVGSWSSPSFVGRRNRLDEIEPAIAVDAQGSVYLAFTTRSSGQVSLAVLPAGSSAWLGPAVISGAETASAPALRIVGDRLIVAYRTAGGVGLAEFQVARPTEILGIQDGPDGVDPLGLVPKRGDSRREQTDDPPPPSE